MSKTRGGSFSYDRDIKRTRRKGDTKPATGKPMREILQKKYTQAEYDHAVSTYLRNVKPHDTYEGINRLPEGTVLHEMKLKNLVSISEYRAAEWLYYDVIQDWGKSGKQTGAYKEAVSVSGGARDYSRARSTEHYERLKRFLDHCHQHEMIFLPMLMEEVILGKSRKIDLVALGRRMTSYETPEEAEAAAVAHIRSFLKTAYEFYAPEMKQREKTTVRVARRTQFPKVALET